MSDFLRNALSMEDNAPAVAVGDSVEIQLSLEQAVVEINEASHDVDMAGYQQEEVERAHMSLEDIAMSLEGLIEEDSRGLDRVSAKGYTLAVEAVLGGALPNPVASLEAFGGETECSEATGLSLEGIKDTLKKLWEGLKRSIANAIRAVGDFFAKLFGGVKKLKARIEDLQKQVKEAKKDKKVAKDKATIPGGAMLALGGKAGEKEIANGATIVKGELAKAADDLAARASKFYGDLVSFYTAKSDPDEIVGLKKGGTTEINESVKTVTGKELPGGKTFQVTTTSETGEQESVSAPKLVEFPGRKAYKAEESDVPSLDFIDARLKDAMDIVKGLEKAEKSRETLKTKREAASKAADKWYEKSDKDLDAKWTAAKVTGALRLANMDLATPLARTDSMAFSYTRALVAAMAGSLAQYKEDKKSK